MASRVDILLKLNYADTGLRSTMAGLTSFIGKFGAIVGVGTSIAQLRRSIETMADYEQAMANTKATLNATGTEMLALSTVIRKAGEESIFSAVEIARGSEALAKAGLKTGEILDALPSTIELASAASMDFAAAVNLQVQAQTNMGIAWSDMARVNQAFIVAANNSVMSTQDIAEAFKYLGPLAKEFGMSVETSATYLAALAQTGIKASQAGTALRTVMLHLAKPTKDAQKVWDAWGISMYDAEYRLKTFGQLLDEMQSKDITLNELFRTMEQRGSPAMQSLLRSTGYISETLDKISTDQGAAGRIALARITTLSGAWKQFNNVLMGTSISAGEGGLTGALRSILIIVTDGIKKINPYIEEMTRGLVDAFKNDQIGTYLYKMLSFAWEKFSSLISGFWIGEAGGSFRRGAISVFIAVGNVLGEVLVSAFSTGIAMFAVGMRSVLNDLAQNPVLSFLGKAVKIPGYTGELVANVSGGRGTSGLPSYIEQEQELLDKIKEVTDNWSSTERRLSAYRENTKNPEYTDEEFIALQGLKDAGSNLDVIIKQVDDLAGSDGPLSRIANPKSVNDFVNNIALAIRAWETKGNIAEGHILGGKGLTATKGLSNTSNLSDEEYYKHLVENMSKLPIDMGKHVMATMAVLEPASEAVTAKITEAKTMLDAWNAGTGPAAPSVDLGGIQSWKDTDVIAYANSIDELRERTEEYKSVLEGLASEDFDTWLKARLAVTKIRGELAVLLSKTKSAGQTAAAPVQPAEKTYYQTTKTSYEGVRKGPDALTQFTTIGESLAGTMMQWSSSLGTVFTQLAGVIQNTLGSAVQGISNGIYGWITGANSFKDAMIEVGRSILQNIIQTLVQIGVQRAIYAALDITTTTTAEAAKTAATAAGVAERTSIETGGFAVVEGAEAAAVAIHGVAETAKTETTVVNAATRKTAGIGEAMTSLVVAAIDSLKSLASIPYIGWALGLAAMGAVFAAGKALIGGLATGGTPAEAAYSGRVSGPGSRTSDTAGLFALSNDEFVIRGNAAAAIGYDNLSFMNTFGRLPQKFEGFATGGLVGGMAGSASSASLSTKQLPTKFVMAWDNREVNRQLQSDPGYEKKILRMNRDNRAAFGMA